MMNQLYQMTKTAILNLHATALLKRLSYLILVIHERLVTEVENNFVVSSQLLSRIYRILRNYHWISCAFQPFYLALFDVKQPF